MQVEEDPKMRRSTRTVFVLRLVLLFAASALAIAGVGVAFRDEAEAGAKDRYSCPMHPEVTAAAPGQCPICKMALEPVTKTKASAPNAASAEHPPDCPMHPKAPSSAEQRTFVVPASVLSVTPTPAMEISPALGATWLPATQPPAGPGIPSDRPILDSPKRRVFVDDVRAPAWLSAPGRLSAVLYRDELIGLAAGERGRFFRSRAPSVPIEVRLDTAPEEPWDASTSLVHFVVETERASGRDRPKTGSGDEGDTGWLEMPQKSRELLVFPESALLRSSDGPFVLVSGATEGTFGRRPVQIGRILKGHVVVLAGLHESERIVVGGAFFVDAEQGQERPIAPVAGVGP
jgi:hypothetical protein